MHAELESQSDGWYGLRLHLRPAEIERLIHLLRGLQQDPGQHFHISSDYSGTGGIGDLEIGVASEQTDNMQLCGLAIVPGNSLPAAGA